jgi:hypothetical protein
MKYSKERRKDAERDLQTDGGLPFGQSNILRDSLHDLGVESFHCFRWFRTSQLRANRLPLDLKKFWIDHVNKVVTDKYAEQVKEDIEYRREWAGKFGFCFAVPSKPLSAVVSIEQHAP